jgi:hypothetical protein
MAPRSKSVVKRASGIEMVTLELPAYAARYLKQMCQRERTVLNNISSQGGAYSLALDAAYDALAQIETVVP